LQDADLNVHRPRRKAARLVDGDRIATFVSSNRYSVLAETDDSTFQAVEFPKMMQEALEALFFFFFFASVGGPTGGENC
jgi:hypothetical protein